MLDPSDTFKNLDDEFEEIDQLNTSEPKEAIKNLEKALPIADKPVD